jgi:hypothetical protein
MAYTAGIPRNRVHSASSCATFMVWVLSSNRDRLAWLRPRKPAASAWVSPVRLRADCKIRLSYAGVVMACFMT